MKIRLPNTARLQALRMDNDQKKYDMEELAPRFSRLAGRHENGTAPVAVSAYQLFQSPPDLADRLVALLELPQGARVLEPSAGLGRILDALQPYHPREVVAIEMASDCARELYRQERAGVTLRQVDFLRTLPEDIGHFDAVAMNPPFHNRSDIRHIRHALDFIGPGGRVAALMMDTAHREAAFRHEAAEWIHIPPGTFKAEGTGVGTILALFIHPTP